MRFIHGGRLRRLVLTTSLGVLAALAIAGATAARVDVGSSGTTSIALFGGGPHGGGHIEVTVCHKPGTPAQQTLMFDDDGWETHIGHGDTLGQCKPLPVDVCLNLEGLQETVPDGYYLKDGECKLTPPPPTDVCPNLEGNQSEVPDGYVLGEDENGRPACVEKEEPPPPPVDKCPNLEGNQATVPDGYELQEDENGRAICVPVTPPTDVCPNLEGDQSDVPDGMVKDELGNCVTPPPPPADVCPNLEGKQATVPNGMVTDGQGNCVTPSPPLPPSVKSDEFMDVQVVKDATPQVQLVNGQAEIVYTVRVRNNGPNQAHNVVLTDAAPGGVTFLAVTLEPSGGNCTVSAALLSCTLGTLGPGVERSIGLSARVTQTGTYVNSATGTGSGKDTNGANNTDDASTLVTAPVTPPTTTPTAPKPPVSKPKPKPVVNICRVLKVTPGMVKANGKRYVVLAKVTRSKTPVKGVQVRFTGTGLSKAVMTDKRGVARLSVRPSRAGILLVKITSVKACNSARIGVVGVFEPPVTG
jgi:uncharacterized repeat protein (TIGR01451 family)